MDFGLSFNPKSQIPKSKIEAGRGMNQKNLKDARGLALSEAMPLAFALASLKEKPLEEKALRSAIGNLKSKIGAVNTPEHDK
ncbi:hypothetical protein [Nostoc sp. ChiSLP03a]|uniref:hypothetical protein n=1 Tax=Nostoc sp. ChiSLP03a TaxID=3075380 RepID=UPI002AD1F73F|nr:hypothetical protein [Nostoc sp. ChiSLP03a]MDZ8213708.1 hypothetical protein [Nostoc sp. ChiSLP03a]